MSLSPRARSIRVLAVVAGAIIAAVAAAFLVPLTAQATTPPISGVVHSADGKPLAGVTIEAIDIGYADTVYVEGTTTSTSTGAFAFSSVASSTSSLWFGATSKTYAQYLGDTSNVDDYQYLGYQPGEPTYVEATLAASGSISGTVTHLPSGALSGYTVRAYGQQLGGSWSVEGSAITSSTGVYTITGLEPGAYKLQAIDLGAGTPLYAPIYSDGALQLSGASTIGVLASKTSTYNFALGKSGSVSGAVTGQDGSLTENLGSVHVTAYRLAGTPGSFTSGTAVDSPVAVTATTGKYTLTGLTPGYYTLEFNPPSTAPYSPSGTQYGRTFLGGTDDVTVASYFQIANGTAVTNQNIQLGAGATIQGHVYNASDGTTPLGDIRIEADYAGRDPDLPSEHARTVLSDPNTGAYSISGLGPGTYDLWVGSHNGTDSNYLNENTGFIRQIINVPGPLTSGDPVTEDIDMTELNDGGLENLTHPTISSTSGTVGDTVSVSTGTWNATDVSSYTYQWLRGDGSVIAGETGSTFTIRPGDVGQYILAKVTAYSFGYGSVSSYSGNALNNISAGTIPTPSPGPSITGTSAVGQTLTVDPGTWGSVSGLTFTFQWQVWAGSFWYDMDNGTGQSVVIDGNDFNQGTQVRVKVFAAKYGYNAAESDVTDGTAVAPSTIQVVTPPKVVKSSSGFSLSGGTWSPSQLDTSSTTWTVVTPANTSTPYTQPVLPLSDTVGDYVSVTQTHTLSGWNQGTTATILAQLGAAPVASGSTAITGTPQFAATLTAPNPTWLPIAGTSTWQWQYESGTTWKNLTGATNSTYVPVATDVGHLLRVVTTRRNSEFATATLIATASSKVALGAAPTVMTNVYTGTVGTNDTVTTTPIWSITPTSSTYEWEYSKTSSSGPFTKISGATHASYTIPLSLLGDWMAVYQTATVAGRVVGTNQYDLDLQVAQSSLTLTAGPKVSDVNGVVSVTGLAFSPSIPSSDIRYLWYYYDENDSTPLNTFPGTDSSVDLATSGFPHAHWMVLIDVPSVSGTTYSYLSPAPILAQKGSIIPSGPITLPASSVGAAIVPPSITWLVDNPTLTYQWQFESGTTWHSIAASAGGTTATFTPSVSYYQHNVRVITTASRTNYTTVSVTSSSTMVGAGAAPTAGTGGNAPGINGYGIGSTWTALPGTWSMSGLTYHYQWAFSWSNTGPWIPITGATAATYTPPDDLYGYYLQVTITASKTGYATGSTTTQTPALQTGTIAMKVAPKVTLTGSTYTVTNNGTWSPTPTSYEYYWYVIDPTTDVATEVSTTDLYTMVSGDASKQIELQMYPDRGNYNSGGTTIIVREAPAIAPTAPITLTGTPVVGGTLTIDVPGWNTPAPFEQVTWYRNGVATGTYINSLTYTPVAADVGKTISAKLTVSKDGYPGATYSFASTPTYSDVVLATTVNPLISGTPNVGDTLTVSTGTWNTTGLVYAYQWYHDGSAIPGATSSSYQLGAGDFETEMTADVTASKAFFTPQTEVSQAVTAETDTAYITNTLNPPITITGSDVLNSGVLTANVGGTWDVPVTYEVSWQISNDGGTIWNNANSQSSLTFALTAANGVADGSEIRVELDAAAPGYGAYYADSAVVTVP